MADCSGHLSWVQRVQFSADGSQLLSCSDDQTVRVRVCVCVCVCVRSWKTWKSHGICKRLFTGLENSLEKKKNPKFGEIPGNKYTPTHPPSPVCVCVCVCVLSQLWETKKVHTSSAVCLKRDSDVLFNDDAIVVSAADNCNRLQVSRRGAAEGRGAGGDDVIGNNVCVCVCVSGP